MLNICFQRSSLVSSLQSKKHCAWKCTKRMAVEKNLNIEKYEAFKVNVENHLGHERRSAVTPWTNGNNSNAFFLLSLLFSSANVIRDYVCRLLAVLRIRRLDASPRNSLMVYCAIAVASQHTHSYKHFDAFSLFCVWSFRLCATKKRRSISWTSVKTAESRVAVYIVEYFISQFLHPFVFNSTNLLSKYRKHMAHANGTYTPCRIETNEYCQI